MAKGDLRGRYSRNNRTSRIKYFKKSKTDHLKLPAHMTVEEAIIQFKGDPDVEYAEPNYLYSVNKIPNDEHFNKLWGLHNTGQEIDGIFGTDDVDIDAPEAWEKLTDAGDVIVAVVDSGVDYNHPDLSANLWINIDEIPDNGIDDDGNGQVDDIRGWDFVKNDNDPMDQYGHGTHVSGIIGAVGDNSIGITGVAWNVKLMAVRGLGADGYGYTSDLINAIEYASANGADIINISWGGEENSAALKDTINNSSVLFVCAAGNDALDTDATPHYPSAYDCPNIISVAAMDNRDDLADFSNYGSISVDVGAPGVDIYSTLPARKIIFQDDFDDGTLSGWSTGGVNNTWGASSSEYISAPYSLADSPSGNYQSNTSSEIKSPSFDLSSEKHTTLKFMFNANLAPTDCLNFEISTNGTNWTEADEFFGSTDGWVESIFDLSELDGFLQAAVKLKMRSSSSENSDGCYIDDISITSMATSYDGSEYGYKSGTSMAAPYVSGLAALVKALRPEFTALDIKNIIENTVDKLSSRYQDNLSTAGRVNALRAVMVARKTGYLMGPEFQLSPVKASPYDTNENPSVAFSGESGFIVWSSSVLTGQDDWSYMALAQKIDAQGNKIGNPTQVNLYGGEKILHPTVISLPNNTFMVSWWQWNIYSDQYNIHSRIMDASGNMLSYVFTTYAARGGAPNTHPQAVTFNGDRFIIMWGTSSYLAAKVFTLSGERITSKNGFGLAREKSKLLVLENGDLLLFFERYGLYGQIYDLDLNEIGSRLVLDKDMSIGTTFDYINASMLSGDRFVASWSSYDKYSGTYEKKSYGRIFQSDGTPHGPIFDIPSFSSKTSIATHLSGQYFLTYCTRDNQDRDQTSGIFAQLFNWEGEKIGSEFLVNFTTKGNQVNPKIIATTSQTFLALWESDHMGNGNETFARTVSLIDSDSDDLFDAFEMTNCTETSDADTDDDGIHDGVEDKNSNGWVDAGETDPCNSDTDGDGIQDGTELGYTLLDIGPDTNINVFIPDSDPSTITNPLLKDTDGDSFNDGQEDENKNGRVDAGESDPNNKPSVNILPAINLLLLSD